MAFLWHTISEEGILVDPSKVQSVKNWPFSKSATEIRSFLRLRDIIEAGARLLKDCRTSNQAHQEGKKVCMESGLC